jgi:hypothetical protein
MHWSKDGEEKEKKNNITLYLCAELNSWWSITESEQIQTAAAIRKHKDRTKQT